MDSNGTSREEKGPLTCCVAKQRRVRFTNLLGGQAEERICCVAKQRRERFTNLLCGQAEETKVH